MRDTDADRESGGAAVDRSRSSHNDSALTPPPLLSASSAEDAGPTQWKRVKDGVYSLIRGDTVLATVERYDPPSNSHFSLWSIHGQSLSEPTLRDAKARVEKQLCATPPPSPATAAPTPQCAGPFVDARDCPIHDPRRFNLDGSPRAAAPPVGGAPAVAVSEQQQGWTENVQERPQAARDASVRVDTHEIMLRSLLGAHDDEATYDAAHRMKDRAVLAEARLAKAEARP